MYDSTAALLVVSYLKTSSANVYGQTFTGTTASQSEFTIYTATTVPSSYLMHSSRINSKLAGMLRDNTSQPYTGRFGTLDWSSSATYSIIGRTALDYGSD